MWEIHVIISEEVNSQYMKSFDDFVCETTYFYEKARITGRSHKAGLCASGHKPSISGHSE
jgi:hypothetical protein